MLCWWDADCAAAEFAAMQIDIAKVSWLINECKFVVVDGHHRLNALWKAKERGMLPNLKRVIQSCSWVAVFGPFIG